VTQKLHNRFYKKEKNPKTDGYFGAGADYSQHALTIPEELKPLFR
jgi:hypothetical protein